MQANELELRSVETLRAETFIVPAYQRGYRWTRQQVVELLEDVWEFARRGGRARGEFYCLQPVVVAASPEGGWEVVDGQQRLTTLHLLLSHFNERKAEKYRYKSFEMSYKTRPASAKFLQRVRPEDAAENIDFFYMAEAAAAIEAWFEERSSIVEDCESTFRNDVKVIWYEITGDVRPTDVFRRLNVGKIPLADAELVKALFLRASNFKGEDGRLQQMRQLQIASEWDAIERRLQDDDFWYFLTNSSRESNRIDLILRLCADSQPAAKGSAPWNEDSIFHAFDHRLRREGSNAWQEWAQVKRVFLTLVEWFEDPVLHHLVGFVATQSRVRSHDAVLEVTQLAERAGSKQEFRALLKQGIRALLFRRSWKSGSGEPLRDFIREDLAGLEYSPDRVRIRAVLLLFNLVTLMASGSNMRFPFGAYKRERWDIEHIRSVASRMPERVDEQKAWLARVVDFFGGANRGNLLIDRADALVRAEKFDGPAFRDLFEKLREQHDPGQDVDVDNSIGNLTLLDAETNRSYGNAMFPLKRRRVIERDRTGGFVPLCTKNAFLKYYSTDVDRMLMWNKTDSQAHAEAIVERLATFFEEGHLA
ncbi:DUF262 domain-containing protein [Ramlibacter sp. Leaf400]|uniref:DUF262 domain-containing protein n=1 Tax=Ramlibacter sp. Leaf400 TaxID=1736365 RepID=UPI0006F4D411|nr:DUF262 domain-containing protein [Ramlibacter sp. Leaf400]KQT10325.1 hypothetical protein ASG30_10795 [Ramlibacter sp. Leaf400]